MHKEIEGAPGYEIYDDGRVYSHKSNRFLSCSLDNNNGHGYLQAQLFVDGKRIMKKVHRLVAEAFIPNPLNLPCVNHKDENVLNNHYTNLEWCDYSYNNSYGTRTKRVTEKLKKVQPNKKTIKGINLKDGKEYIFISVAEAARFTGDINHRPNIVACLSGRQKTAYGYSWEYFEGPGDLCKMTN